jgi:hypothetical protein
MNIEHKVRRPKPAGGPVSERGPAVWAGPTLIINMLSDLQIRFITLIIKI